MTNILTLNRLSKKNFVQHKSSIILYGTMQKFIHLSIIYYFHEIYDSLLCVEHGQTMNYNKTNLLFQQLVEIFLWNFYFIFQFYMLQRKVFEVKRKKI